MIIGSEIMQVWFLKLDHNDELSTQINRALEKMEDDSGLTHTVFRPAKHLLFDVTINGSYFTDLTDEQIELLMPYVSYIVEIKSTPEYKNVRYVKVVERISEMVNQGFKLIVNDLLYWFKNKGNKDDVVMCTDVVIDLLNLEDKCPPNLLPSQLLQWFIQRSKDEDFLEEENIRSITIRDLTDGQLH